MSFVSIEFLLLLLIVYVLYWASGRRVQNAILLVASYVFYGWWDWRFLGLIAYSTLIDYFCGLGYLDEKKRIPRKVLLGISLVTNLSLLGFFKYYNFFIDSAAELLGVLGFAASPATLAIVLPVGISFYTFQTLSYTIDVYRGKIHPTRDLVEFSTFVAFFPQLVAGPIERAGHLLGQFARERAFDLVSAKDGLRQMLWGFAKKIVVADNLALIVDGVYAAPEHASGGMIAFATVCFAFQIYCDFSAYSDIAIGSSKLLGIDLMRNFAYPYFSRDMAEFWHRWHISLSSWFRDYVYIPLGGSRGSEARRVFNVLTTFTASGLWHGANWTYAAWGLLNGVLVLFWKGTAKPHDVPGTETWRDLPRIFAVFAAACVAWVFFRAASIEQAALCIAKIFTWGGVFTAEGWTEVWNGGLFHVWFLVTPVVLLEWLQRTRHHALDIARFPLYARWSAYVLVIFAIYILGQWDADVQFIYFQF